MTTETELRDKLFDLKRKGRQELLEILGIDVRKLRAFEERQDKDYRKLEKEFDKFYKKSGEAIAKRHNSSLTHALRAMERQIDRALNQHPRLSDLDSFYFCRCYYPHTAEEKGSGEEIELMPSFGGLNAGSVQFEQVGNIAHMLARADSPNSGDSSRSLVTAYFKFAFTPEVDGNYCIRPIVHLNGYWIFWAGSSCETYESLPVISMVVRVGARVEQLSDTLKQTSHDVLSTPIFGANASGFHYDSEINEELTMEVELQGGDQAVVFVECELDVFVNNGSHAKIDLQSSPHFYFEVPTVKWGTPCFRPRIVRTP